MSYFQTPVDGMAELLPPMVVERVRERVREVARRSYVDGLRDGFVQGVVERANRPAEWGERIVPDAAGGASGR